MVYEVISDTKCLDLNAALDGMIQRGEDGRFWCSYCNKTFSGKKECKRPAEIHMNLTHSCIVCQKEFKTRNALAIHYTRYHPDEVVSPWTMK